MSDDVQVQPINTFLEGADLKTPESAPYAVSRSRALELRGNGLVTFDEAPAEPELKNPAEAAPEDDSNTGRRKRTS